MKALIVYDSTYGNTEKIAQAIAGVVALPDEGRFVRAGQASTADVQGVELLMVGSPTNGGRPTPAMQQFLAQLPRGSLQGVSVAAFDTRAAAVWVKIFGFAAGRIASKLRAKGGYLLVPPRGFIVKGTEGPLADGELEQAALWAKAVIAEHKFLGGLREKAA